MQRFFAANGSGSNWEPNFIPALPTIYFSIGWIFFLCFTATWRSPTWRLVRPASFPPLVWLLLGIAFDFRYTLGNPLRDLAMPTITWSVLCKAAEVCLVYSSGGPKPIRPFLIDSKEPVRRMDPGECANYEWRVVDPPRRLCSWERLIYAIDLMYLRRPGTSPLLAKQGRALEWSQDALNEWSCYLREHKCTPEAVPVHGPVRRFGQPEMPLLLSILQFAVVYYGYIWLYALEYPPSPTVCVAGLYIPVASHTSKLFWLQRLSFAKECDLSGITNSVFSLPWPTQLALVGVFGATVCFVAGMVESLYLLLKKPNPPTEFLAAFDRVVTAPSISRLWGRSWHAMSQRDYVNLASLCPGGSRHKSLQLIYAFMWSGVQHSFMFCRLTTPKPSLNSPISSTLRGMFDPHMMTFFLCQGGGILLERAILDNLPPKVKVTYSRKIAWLRRLWMYTVLLVPGPLFVHSVLKRDLMTKEILDGFTFKALGKMVKGQRY